MKQFISFVKKEFLHIFRDTRTMMILLVMPIIQIILFGFAITTDVRNVKVAVFDPSKDISTERIIHQLDASEYFTVVKYLNSTKEAEEEFKNGTANMVVVFDNNFNENLTHTGEASIQLMVDASDPNQATILTNYATSIISSYQQELMQKNNAKYQIIPTVSMLFNPSMKGAYNFVPGVMGMILMMICAMMTSISIVREKEMGTMEVLLASPMHPLSIILAKAVPYFILSLVNVLTIIVLSVFVLGVPIAGSLFLLIIVSMIFIMCALSLGILISTMADTQAAAISVSGMGLMMPVILLSGMVFPVESMPWILRTISNIIPAKWYISAVKKIMIEGAPISASITEISVLLVITITLVLISLKKFKIRL